MRHLLRSCWLIEPYLELSCSLQMRSPFANQIDLSYQHWTDIGTSVTAEADLVRVPILMDILLRAELSWDPASSGNINRSLTAQ
jgi:hypothetical protein